MAEAARRAESDQPQSGSTPANDNRAPRPRLVAANPMTEKPKPGRPIMYRGYILRYKSPAEWEEFGRLNPDIPPKFWDSPINSPRADKQAKREIQKRERAERAAQQAAARQGQQYPYGVTPEERRAFQKDRTEESLRARKARAQAKQEAKKVAKEQRTSLKAATRSLTGQRAFIGPRRATGQGVVESLTYSFASMIAFLVIGSGTFCQGLLLSAAATFLGLTALAAGSGTVLFKALEFVGVDMLRGNAAGLAFGALLGVAFAFWFLMVVISFLHLLIIKLIMSTPSFFGFTAKTEESGFRGSFWLAVLGCLLPLFILAGFWVRDLKHNHR